MPWVHCFLCTFWLSFMGDSVVQCDPVQAPFGILADTSHLCVTLCLFTARRRKSVDAGSKFRLTRTLSHWCTWCSRRIFLFWERKSLRERLQWLIVKFPHQVTICFSLFSLIFSLFISSPVSYLAITRNQNAARMFRCAWCPVHRLGPQFSKRGTITWLCQNPQTHL